MITLHPPRSVLPHKGRVFLPDGPLTPPVKDAHAAKFPIPGPRLALAHMFGNSPLAVEGHAPLNCLVDQPTAAAKVAWLDEVAQLLFVPAWAPTGPEFFSPEPLVQPA